MRCGEKCFLVEIEVGGKMQLQEINARTPVEARKFARVKYGKETKIESVRKAVR